jgi:TPR repeat protein
MSLSPTSALADLRVQIRRSHVKRQNAPVAVVLQAENDLTRTFDSFLSNYDIRKLAQTYYVAYRVINCTDAIHQTINQVHQMKGPIHCLIIRGHGDKNCIQLGTKSYFRAMDLTSNDFTAFDPTATILLDACEVGQKLARRIHQTAHLAVFAPKNLSNNRNTYLQHCDLHGPEMCSTDELYQAGHDTCDYHEEVLAQRFQYIQERAKNGHPLAQNDLGVCYAQGLGVEPSESLAVRWFTASAEQGCPPALHALANRYRDGHGVKQSFEYAAQLYAQAAEQGYAPSERELGHCYLSGHGVAQSDQLAAEWLSKAANQGNAGAQYGLGFCFYFGRGVTKSFDRAVYWFTRSAKQDFADAQFILGKCFRDGKGVVPSNQKALKWFKRAEQNGHPLAAQEIQKLHSK